MRREQATMQKRRKAERRKASLLLLLFAFSLLLSPGRQEAARGGRHSLEPQAKGRPCLAALPRALQEWGTPWRESHLSSSAATLRRGAAQGRAQWWMTAGSPSPEADTPSRAPLGHALHWPDSPRRVERPRQCPVRAGPRHLHA